MRSELAGLDPALREAAGSGARIERPRAGAPGRQVTLLRKDGVMIGLTVAPILRDQVPESPVRYIICPFAWLDLAGQRLHRRRTRQYTVELSSAQGLEAAHAAVEEAWREALATDRTAILAGPVPLPADTPELD
jgi:hypothetical protein